MGVALLHELGLLQDLTSVGEELGTVRRERDAAGGAVEDDDAELGLELAHGRRETWLRDVELAGRLGDRSALGDLGDVAELGERHGVSSREL